MSHLSPTQKKDAQYTWHPFTHLHYAEVPINITRSEGSYYYDEQGKRYIDGISSWWVNLHGHSHPYLAEKVSAQLRSNAHSIFSGFTHPGAVTLAERLIHHLPSNFSKVFYSDDGSTSVEVALKMALQYWDNKDEQRSRIIAFDDAYHGDTFGGMSVGARNVFTKAFSPLLFDVLRLPLPTAANRATVKNALQAYLHTGQVAAFIFEPLVQGAAGMRMYEAAWLDELIVACREAGVICIADEVMTGFGRTGKLFAIEHLQQQADIICLSKGLTGGVMPLGVTACASFVYEAYLSDDRNKTFFHGHSYTANPTACAAALASLDLMERPETKANIARISARHAAFVQQLLQRDDLLRAESKGTILALEIRTQEKSGYMNLLADKIAAWFIEKGILLRPLGNVLYVLPPYCITDADMDHIYNSIIKFLDELKQ